jgi:hypothetical protein
LNDSPEAHYAWKKLSSRLEDKSLFDAPLFNKGERESVAARALIQELTSGKKYYVKILTADAAETCQVLLDASPTKVSLVPKVSLKIAGYHHRRSLGQSLATNPCNRRFGLS